MLQRCATKQFLSRAASKLPPKQSPSSWIRSQSSVPERSRKFPGSRDGSRFRLWQRRVLLGLVTGVVTSQAYLFYDHRRVQGSFVSYTLVAKEPVSSTASIFHLAPTEQSGDYQKYQDAWSQGIWNVHFKQPQIQIVRAYTPLPPQQETGAKPNQSLRFLIRHDPHGEVSSYLHRLPIGASIEMRGPNLEYRISPDVRQVVFFAGGTGIAPALQVAHAMFDKVGEGPRDSENSKSRKLHILWANRRREDCQGGVSDAPVDEARTFKSSFGALFGKARPQVVPPTKVEKGVVVKELEELKEKYPGQITIEYFVNAEGTWIDEDVVFNSLSQFDDKDFSSGSPVASEKRQIIISGPNGFITHLAGPKEWRNGREEQGPVSRIVAHAIAQNPHHVKIWKV